MDSLSVFNYNIGVDLDFFLCYVLYIKAIFDKSKTKNYLNFL